SSKLTLNPRDSATLSVFLRHEPSADVVTFNAEFGFARGGVVAGIAGGRFEDRELDLRKDGAAAPKALAEFALRAPAAVNETVEVSAQNAVLQNSATLTKTESASPHVRSYFPEALYINPEIITDHNGLASISIPLADSITTWRMALVASTQHGVLGSATSSLKVFQDFFVDLDLPVTLT